MIAENDDELFFHEYLEGGIARKKYDVEGENKGLYGDKTKGGAALKQFNPRKALFVRRLPTVGIFL